MNNKKVIIGSTFLLVLLLFLFIKKPVLQVSYADGAFYLKEKEFEIGWIHSVEKEPWFEQYMMKNNKLYLVGTRFKTFGAGMPSDGEIIPSSDGFIHMAMNREMEFLNLTVSERIKTTLHTGDTTIPLYKLAGEYGSVTIEIKDQPLWQLIRGDKK
jgi:hypothetical protein